MAELVHTPTPSPRAKNLSASSAAAARTHWPEYLMEAAELGLFTRVVAADALESVVRETALQLGANAPLTIRASKEMIRRIAEHRRLPAGRDHDLIEMCYLSDDFRSAVEAFAAKRKPSWAGR